MNEKTIEKLEQGNEKCRWYQFTNNKNERVVIEIHSVECNSKDKKCLPNLWVKHGFIKTPIYNYLYVSTYVYTEDNCVGKYNPTIIKGTTKINFDWLLEATKENEERLLNEIHRLANL